MFYEAIVWMSVGSVLCVSGRLWIITSVAENAGECYDLQRLTSTSVRNALYLRRIQILKINHLKKKTQKRDERNSSEALAYD